MITIDNNIILEEIGKQLDISPTMYKLAVDRYTSVAEYLSGKGLNAHFYTQGSFRLGTVTRPLRNGIESDYDIDLVCQILINKSSTSPSETKHTVGNLLKESERYNKILDEEGRRCWTLIYAEKDGIGFHLDILPSVCESKDIINSLIDQYNVAPKYAESAIAITNKENSCYRWQSSNPDGYGKWFDEINKPFYDLIEKELKKQIYEEHKDIFASIDDVPQQLIRTPLQRVIQILKRHRDLRFNGSSAEDDKPISMIITTLVAQIAKNESCLTTDLFLLLKFITLNLIKYADLLNDGHTNISQQQYSIIKREVNTGKWYIPNPVNPTENFADRWHENNNRKAKAFFQWIDWVYKDLVRNLEKTDFDINSLSNVLGKNVVEKANANYKLLISKNNNIERRQDFTVNIYNPNKPWRQE